MKNLLARFVREEGGQDLIEYALLAGFVAVGAIAFLQAFNTSLQGVYEAIAGRVEEAPAGGAGS